MRVKKTKLRHCCSAASNLPSNWVAWVAFALQPTYVEAAVYLLAIARRYFAQYHNCRNRVVFSAKTDEAVSQQRRAAVSKLTMAPCQWRLHSVEPDYGSVKQLVPFHLVRHFAQMTRDFDSSTKTAVEAAFAPELN
jgi:stage V sporulation protein SpoVS